MFSSPLDRLVVPSATTDSFNFFNELQQTSESTHRHQSAHEGQLAVDVFETEDQLLIVATMAGARPEDVSIHLQNDCLTIRGFRPSPAPPNAEHFHQECFWGSFSRTIVLPVDVKSDVTRSEYKNGVLTIYLSKVRPATSIPIMIVED